MKRLFLTILFLLLASPCWAATYYVDCGAAAGGDGSLSTPWDQLSDLSGLTGDQSDTNVYLKRGCTFRETLTVPGSGTSGHPFTFGAYGSGEKPIISGATALTSWTQYLGATGNLIEDNFDDGNTTGWTKAGGGTLTVSTEQAYSGTYSVKSTAAYTTLYQSFSAANQVWFRFYIKPTAWPTEGNTEFVAVRVGSSAKIYVYMTTAGVVGYWNLVASDGANGTQSLVLNQWNLVEGTVKANATTGVVQIKVNGVTSTDVTGANTGADNWDRIDFGLLSYAATVYFDNFGLDNAAYLGAVDPSSTTYYKSLAADPNAVLVDGVLAEEKATLGALTVGTWFWDAGATNLYYKTAGLAITSYTVSTYSIPNCVFTNNKDYITFDNLTFSGPTQYNGIYGNHGGEGIVIQNCSFLNFYGPAIEFTGDAADNLSITISGNTFADAGRQYDIYLYPNAGSTSSATITNNTTTMSAYKGNATLPDSSQRKFVELDNPDSATVSYNTITFPSITGDTSTILITGGTAPEVHHNSITGGNHGIVIHDTAGGSVHHNRTINTYDDGIWVYGTSDGVSVYYNVVSGSYDDGIDVEAINTTVYNNTVYGSRDVGIFVRNVATGSIVKNNITSENGQAGSPTTGDEGGYEIYVHADASATATIDYNIYYHTTAKVTSTPFYWAGTAYSFANWKTNSSQDANSLNSDPLFVNAAGGNFKLKGNSPARRAGADVSLYTDYSGRGVSATPTLGAYQFYGAPKIMKVGGKIRVFGGGSDGAPASAPVSKSYILLEGGDKILLEAADFIVME